MTDEERDAARLAAMLDGADAEFAAEDAEVVGLLKHAAGAEAPDPWARIRAAAPRPVGSRWALGGWALAASIVLFMLIGPSAPAPLPDGPDAADLDAAMQAFDPASGPPLARLGALDHVAAKERARVVAELTR